MSLLGKILALFNIFGAFGLVYIASVDYGKRQTWAYNVLLHQLTLDGIPLNEQETDSEHMPLVDRLPESAAGQLFTSVGGNPVLTQQKEVERQKAQIDGKLQGLTGKKLDQSRLLANMLLPFTENYLLREQYLAALTHLASDTSYTALKTRCKKALTRALTLPKGAIGNQRTLGDDFRLAFRVEGGAPAEAVVAGIVAKLGNDRTKARDLNLDAVIDEIVDQQLVDFQAGYQALFDQALGKPLPVAEGSTANSSETTQKRFIAQLLFGLCVFAAEDTILNDPSKEAEKKILLSQPNKVDYQKALIETETYKQLVKRVHVVCGLRMSIQAIHDRSEGLRKLTYFVDNAIRQERDQFYNTHEVMISLIREQANLVDSEKVIITEAMAKITTHDEVIKKRKAEITRLQDELFASQEATKTVVEELERSSTKVLELRQALRDALRDTEMGEKKVQALEKQIRDLERKR